MSMEGRWEVVSRLVYKNPKMKMLKPKKHEDLVI